jgi:hypothetical protein
MSQGHVTPHDDLEFLRTHTRLRPLVFDRRNALTCA